MLPRQKMLFLQIANLHSLELELCRVEMIALIKIVTLNVFITLLSHHVCLAYRIVLSAEVVMLLLNECVLKERDKSIQLALDAS